MRFEDARKTTFQLRLDALETPSERVEDWQPANVLHVRDVDCELQRAICACELLASRFERAGERQAAIDTALAFRNISR
jgi:hypothetical protein